MSLFSITNFDVNNIVMVSRTITFDVIGILRFFYPCPLGPALGACALPSLALSLSLNVYGHLHFTFSYPGSSGFLHPLRAQGSWLHYAAKRSKQTIFRGLTSTVC